MTSALLLALAGLVLQEPSTDGPPPVFGVRHASQEAMAPGYTLFAPLHSRTTWLIDAGGRAVHSWQGEEGPGNSVYLTDEGHLLRAEKLKEGSRMTAGGEGGRLVELTWDGEALAEAFAKLGADARLAATLGDAGYATASTITWTGVIERLVGS